MNKDWAIYEKDTGRILRHVWGSSLVIASPINDAETEDSVEGIPRLEYDYVIDNIITPRPAQQTTLSNAPVIANGIDSTAIQQLPIPCTVSMNGEVYEVTDGLLELSFDTPGEYQVTVTAFPYLDKTFTIEAI